MTQETVRRVADVMTADPVMIDGMASLKEALAIMRARGISCLVVGRRDADDEFGLLLVSDIARDISAKNRPVSRTQVYEVMQKPAPTIDSNMMLKYAVRYMTRFDLSHCLVLRGRDLAGIISVRDIAIHYHDSATVADS